MALAAGNPRAGEFGAFDALGEDDSARSGGKATVSKLVLAEMVFVPWLIMVLILVCFMLGGSTGQDFVLWFVPLLLFLLVGAYTWTKYQSYQPTQAIVGCLCLVALVVSLCVGIYACARSLKEYDRLGRGASYSNVLPSELSTTKNDATSLLFSSNTMVDTSRAYGFTDATAGSGQTYCVAPVATAESASDAVNFWAAGMNCCGSRSDFQCGDVAKADVHGAIVFPEKMMNISGFKSAVNGAEKAYNMQVGDKYILLTWHEDPDGYRVRLWRNTLILFLVFAGVYLIISTMVACALAPFFAPHKA